MESETNHPKNKYESHEGVFTSRGLSIDAINIWAHVKVYLQTLKHTGEMKKDDIEETMNDLKRPIRNYEEYLRDLYSEADVQKLLDFAEPTAIKEHDDLVKKYNDLASKGNLTPELANNITEEALKMFKAH